MSPSRSVPSAAPCCFSDVEMEWFTVTSWNYGVFYSRLNLITKAEQLMGIALRLLEFAPTLNSRGADMHATYSKILDLKAASSGTAC